jgi:amino acid transporter
MIMAEEPTQKPIKLLALVALAGAGVFSVANNSDLAADGMTIFTYLALAAIGYFLPCALIAGELGSRIQGNGGVYDWVNAGLGREWGVMAAIAQWGQNLPFLPYLFAFLSACTAALVDPSLMSSRWWAFGNMLVFIWVCTLVNLFSLQFSTRLVTIGFLIGNLIPALVLMWVGAAWLISGRPSAVSLDLGGMAPQFTFHHLMIFTGVMQALVGIEVVAPMASKISNPRRTYPVAMGLTALLVVGGYAVSVLPVAIAVPQERLSLEYGTLTAFKIYFDAFGIPWAKPLMALLLIAGVISVGLVWILLPAQTMQSMAERQLVPNAFAICNRRGMPVGALILQGVLSTLFALPVLFLPNVGSAFFLSIAASVQLHLFMYVIIFAAFIRIKMRDPASAGVFVIPGGTIVGAGIALLATFTCLVAIVAGFIPPQSVLQGSAFQIASYLGVLVGVCASLFAVRIWLRWKDSAEKRKARSF